MPVLFFSPPALPSAFPAKTAKVSRKHPNALSPKGRLALFVPRSNNETSAASPVVVEEAPAEEEAPVPVAVEEKRAEEKRGAGALQSNGAAVTGVVKANAPRFKDPRWVRGTWDLAQFKKDGSTDWDAVIDAEARRRKWLEENPEASSNEDPIVFDTSIVPWWIWMKRFHLPEAELLNGRAAMIGFFMAYFVDALTGVGLVDQMGSFFCKTLLLVAVAGVLLVRKNEDIETLKKLLEETTFYDKQWQATWKDDDSGTR